MDVNINVYVIWQGPNMYCIGVKVQTSVPEIFPSNFSVISQKD